ncbi:hypothetical protein M409DRAFT_66293 [Zasmidium cellare ATCC 36951]|uniref:VPS9 domain-containing protein n=1 Tax=Zasmidium cellare ATCC 36951 TaxID=1080233 RepID=A0A6A6CMZ0_ZASCE|nr:uncharacterized protein M409DRAFT_66293 [Zasmidium cellare ATCC 36951]KAF2167292.1 hypothetical protein M409DRAFT_66293 [Zasmidium cellare ATCC 36951]
MGADNRPRTLHVSRSFTRMDNTPSPMSSPRKRASTLQEAGIPSIPEARHIATSPELGGKKPMADVFENNEEDEHIEGDGENTGPELNVPSTFDELPIEIKSMCERFLESLSAKVHPTPLSAEQLSELFQDFYERASQHVATHIASLSSRIGRDTPPASSASSNSRKQLGRSRAGSGAKKGSSDDLAGSIGGEMLTASEVADRKKARKLLEHKRVALEEAVERGVCEKVYDKIWKHRSADDDARDEKLRSRTAALSLVGIGLKELHMDQDPAKADVRKTAEEREDEINQSLAAAREALIHMDDDHYPLGKLQHLTAAHKSIVETLSQLFPSSSSADEILPTLIYTLITCPQEGINVVSNLNFIQRFRTSSKVDGEAAYCLVNLEAAISFLETVDLSSLRADELPQGPAKMQSRPVTPSEGDKPPPSPRPAIARTLTPTISPMTANSSDQSTPNSTAKAALPSPSSPNPTSRPGMHQRRISGLMQAQVDRIEAGRDNFLNAADKFYDSVNGTLDNSLQFLFGRFKEQVATNDSALPKTLEDARKLVSPPSTGEDDDSVSVSGRSSPGIDDPLNAGNKASTTDNKMLELLGGRKQLRDRSVDSARSGGSGNGRRVTFDNNKPGSANPTNASQGNLFASINPLNRFGMPNFPRFGRAGTMPTPSPPAEKPTPTNNAAAAARLSDIVESPATTLKPGSSEAEFDAALEKTRSRESTVSVSGTAGAEDDDLNAREALAGLRKLKGPKRRFLDAKSANELRVGEVEELLVEYKRLAKALADAISS